MHRSPQRAPVDNSVKKFGYRGRKRRQIKRLIGDGLNPTKKRSLKINKL
jgi:hypothetical protein